MFRKNINNDISDEEYNKYFLDFEHQIDSYLINDIIPEVCSYIISYGYNNDILYYDSFDNHISYGISLFNINIKDINIIKDKVKKILENKYNLIVISTDPLDFTKKA